jgi:addiction module HigA family antidote
MRAKHIKRAIERALDDVAQRFREDPTPTDGSFRAAQEKMRAKLRSADENSDPNVTAHPGHLLRRELVARSLRASGLALRLGIPSGRITQILNGRRSISADTAVRLGRYFGNSPRFWLDLQSQYDIAIIERDRGREIMRRVRPADAA